MGTGALVLCNDDLGCSRSTRQYAKQAARSVVGTTTALISLFFHHEQSVEEHVAAQKTGAVWAACDQMGKLPKGNRTSMRRDLLLWARDCNDTLQEFTDMIAAGPAVPSEDGKETGQSWDDFCGGEPDQYSEKELPVAKACVALVKGSRGCMNVAINACECAGEAVQKNQTDEDARKGLLRWISTIHDMARVVGEGMTDLGTLLYPPLELKGLGEEGDHLAKRVGSQRDAIVALAELVLDGMPEGVDSFDLTEDTTEMATKLRAAANARCEEARASISASLL